MAARGFPKFKSTSGSAAAAREDDGPAVAWVSVDSAGGGEPGQRFSVFEIQAMKYGARRCNSGGGCVFHFGTTVSSSFPAGFHYGYRRSARCRTDGIAG